jgi:hypothetical protein
MLEPPYEQYVGRRARLYGYEGTIGKLPGYPGLVLYIDDRNRYGISWRDLELIDEKPDNKPLPLPG